MVLDVISALPPKTASMLDQFCAHGNKLTGVGQPKDFERFCKFVVMAHEEDVSLPEEALCAYLEHNGWTHEVADTVAKRFRGASVLLEIYDKFHAGEWEL